MDIIKKSIIQIQPHYNELVSNYSKTYLSGSFWYVGDDIMNWWENANNVRYFNENKQTLLCIVEILLIYKKNQLSN